MPEPPTNRKLHSMATAVNLGSISAFKSALKGTAADIQKVKNSLDYLDSLSLSSLLQKADTDKDTVLFEKVRDSLVSKTVA